MTAARLMPVGVVLGFDVLDVCVGMNVVLAVPGLVVGVLNGEAGAIAGVVFGVVAGVVFGVVTGVVFGVVTGVEIEIEVEADVVETLTMLTLRSGVAAHWNCT
jgi:ribose/xylose/arabinose/galactoside ABC-type transport system permease subunit